MSDWKNVQYKDGKFKTGEGGGGGGSSTLSGLDDVNLSNLSDGQVLQYDNANSKWVNATPSGNSGHNYSTTEQVIGTWIDSKPLYEKTFELTTPSNSGATSIENITSLNINQVILIEGFCLLTNDTFVPINFYAGSSSFVDVYATKTSITCSCGSSYYSKPLKVIIRYTKTTD